MSTYHVRIERTAYIAVPEGVGYVRVGHVALVCRTSPLETKSHVMSLQHEFFPIRDTNVISHLMSVRLAARKSDILM